MSKTAQKNKEAKAASKTKKAAKTEAAQIPNYGKCCTCRYFPKHIKGEAQPCKTSGKYVARKAVFPCWKER